MIRQIVQIGQPVLRQIAKPVDDPAHPDIRQLTRDMADTLADFQKRTGYGRGIAAPQIGVSKRVVVVDMPELGGVTALINPVITRHSEETFLVWDACFSYFFLFFQVQRYKTVQVQYTTLDNVRRTVAARGGLSELLQHELEHLDGELAIDKVHDPKTYHSVAEWEARIKPYI